MFIILCTLLILLGLALVIIAGVSIFKNMQKSGRTENVKGIKISSIIMIISGAIIFAAGIICLYFLISGKIVLPLK